VNPDIRRGRGEVFSGEFSCDESMVNVV
jgi:hypothetical protein